MVKLFACFEYFREFEIMCKNTDGLESWKNGGHNLRDTVPLSHKFIDLHTIKAMSHIFFINLVKLSDILRLWCIMFCQVSKSAKKLLTYCTAHKSSRLNCLQVWQILAHALLTHCKLGRVQILWPWKTWSFPMKLQVCS